MRPTFHVPLLALGFAAGAQAQNVTLMTSGDPAALTAMASTTVVSELTTVCGEATVLTQNGNYYTCTEAMTLVITDCPCTMTKPSRPTYAPAPYQTTLSTVTLSPSCPSAGFNIYNNNNSGGLSGPYPTPVPPGAHYTPLGVAVGTGAVRPTGGIVYANAGAAGLGGGVIGVVAAAAVVGWLMVGGGI